jgi:Flp pilus assembly pilin Flp
MAGHKSDRRFLRHELGVSAVEFAVLAPFAALLLLAGYDMGRFVLATQRVEAVANSIAEMYAQSPASAFAATPGDAVVSQNDVQFYWNSAFFTFPQALTQANYLGVPWWNILTVNVASVQFKATPNGCTNACTYKPKIKWSQGWRSCSTTLTAAPDTAPPSANTLPTDMFGPGSLIVVDVTYTWQPTFGASYLPSIPITRSVYMPPRYVPFVESNAAPLVSTCA